MLEVTSHFNAASDPLRYGIHDTLNSGNYHVEPDVGRQLVQIKSGIDHMRLDNNFLDSSQYWGNKFNTTPVRNEKYGESFPILQIDYLFRICINTLFCIRNQSMVFAADRE